MICKYCGAEIEDGLTLCPSCQKELTEEAPAAEETPAAEENPVEEKTPVAEEAPAEEATQKKQKFPLLPVILCGLAACAIVALILFGPKLLNAIKSGKKQPRSEGMALSQEAIQQRGVYSVQDIESPEDERMQTIVAECAGSELSNEFLQVLYRNGYYQFMNQYGMYAAMFGLDSEKPFSEQNADEGMTWEQSFLSDALNNANQIAAAKKYCEDNNIELSEELQEYLTSLPESLEESAVASGFASAQEYVETGFGKGVSVESFLKYYELLAYEEAIFDSIAVEREEVEAFYDANTDLMTSYGIAKQTVDVRHILIKPEDADGDGTSTDEEWAAAKEEADRIYALYLEDATEDNFAKLATENTDDPGSAETGGLYEGVLPGQMVQQFNDWLFNESHQAGDTDIVETTYGYHIMYYVAVKDNDAWYTDCESLCKSDKMQQLLTEITGQYPMTVYIGDIVLDEIGVPAEETETESPQG